MRFPPVLSRRAFIGSTLAATALLSAPALASTKPKDWALTEAQLPTQVRLKTKLAPGENVRAALALVARGEVPFGIVYSTDAIAERKVRVVGEFPANLHPPIVYPAAILADSRSKVAEALLRLLRSAEVQAVWRKFGFGVEK